MSRISKGRVSLIFVTLHDVAEILMLKDTTIKMPDLHNMVG